MTDTSCKSRTILLIDQNAYFASVEQVCNPLLRGKPVIVCGQGRTIVTTASYEARAFGIKTGMTLPEARKLCPKVIPVVANVDKYIDTSHRIHKIFLEFTNKVEVFSIDECFLDVTDCLLYWGGAKKICLRIKELMLQRTGLKCSIGVGPNKIVSKIAAKMKKPDGLTIIMEPDIPKTFSILPVEKLQGVGIGGKISEKLKMLGIHTARQLGDASDQMLSAEFGIMGIFYKNIGRGRGDSEVKLYDAQGPVRSVGHSHTMANDTRDLDVIRSYLQMLCEKTATRMREYGLMGRTVCFYARYSDFNGFGKQRTMKHYFNHGTEILDVAWGIFKEVLPLKQPVRLVGVSITNVSKLTGQQTLFSDTQKNDKLMQVMDEINEKFGDSTIKPMSLLTAEKLGILERCGVISTRLIR
jgi:DNA polymerase-4